MAERSTRSRLTYSGGAGRTYAESLHWGMRWEGYAAVGSAALAAGLTQKSAWPALITSSGNTPKRSSRTDLWLLKAHGGNCSCRESEGVSASNEGWPGRTHRELLGRFTPPLPVRGWRWSTVEKTFGPRTQRENSTTKSRNFKPESPSQSTGAAYRKAPSAQLRKKPSD